MSSIIVYCGNGGDYEYELERYNWAGWISEHIPECRRVDFYTTVGFTISPHREADKAIIKFDNPHNAILFALRVPKYIHTYV